MRNQLLIEAVVNNLLRIARENDFYGCTLTPSTGTPLCPADSTSVPQDVVTLYSVNIDLRTPDFGKVVAFLSSLPLQQNRRVVVGLYRFDGQPYKVSVDVNVVVDQKHRNATLAFAKRNGQQAIWDHYKSLCVPAGGDGETVLKPSHDFGFVVREVVEGRNPLD